MICKRAGCAAAKALSSSRKITERSSRLAYKSVIRPLPLSNALRKIENTGVMPLPPASSTKSPSSVRGVNTPAGAITSNVWPARTVSHTQLEPRPPCTRLMVTRGASSTPGALDME